MSNILVTGASGNVGKYVAKHLIMSGASVTVAGTRIDNLEKTFSNTAKIVKLDFTDKSTFSKALENVDRIFIMRPPHLGKAEDLYPFIDFLKERKEIKMITFLSLIGIEHNPIPPHYKIEKYIENTKIPYCHIRPSFFMQNISEIHSFEIKKFNKIIIPVKKALTSFIDAEDIGELIAKVLSEPKKHTDTSYSLTGPEALDYYEVAEILSKKLGRKIKYGNPSPKLAKNYWIKIRGLDKNYSKVMSMLYLMTRLGTAKKVTSTFEKIMGKKPTSFTKFVEKNIRAWAE